MSRPAFYLKRLRFLHVIHLCPLHSVFLRRLDRVVMWSNWSLQHVHFGYKVSNHAIPYFGIFFFFLDIGCTLPPSSGFEYVAKVAQFTDVESLSLLPLNIKLLYISCHSGMIAYDINLAKSYRKWLYISRYTRGLFALLLFRITGLIVCAIYVCKQVCISWWVNQKPLMY